MAARGHDTGFLADLSLLKGTERYDALIAAYSERHPGEVGKAFAHKYPPSRLLGRIFASDDDGLLRTLLQANGRLTVEAPLLGETPRRPRIVLRST